MRHFLTFILVLLITGCDKPVATQFQITNDTHDLMAWVLDPAAQHIWGSAGFIITAEGETDLSPTTNEGWDSVKHSASVLAESSNLLLIPERSRGADWDAYAIGLAGSAGLAVAAADKKDATALFDAGGAIYQVCLACHNQYWVDGEDEP